MSRRHKQSQEAEQLPLIEVNADGSYTYPEPAVLPEGVEPVPTSGLCQLLGDSSHDWVQSVALGVWYCSCCGAVC